MIVMGPVFHLSWFGQLFPCLEKEEDRKARQALQFVNRAGFSIAWYPKGGSNPNKSSVADNVVNFFKSAIAKTTSPSSSSQLQQQESERVPARLVIRDDPETAKPEIWVEPFPAPQEDESKKPKEPSVGYKLNIALHRVGTVDMNPNTGIIKIMAKRPKDPEQSAKTLVCFALTKGGDVDVPTSADERDMFVHYFLVLMEWERRRRAALGTSELDDDEEEEQRGNFLTQRAQKAAHFAKRELELQQSKRQRESRKAKLVQDSGGLKYTALAMMQMNENAA